MKEFKKLYLLEFLVDVFSVFFAALICVLIWELGIYIFHDLRSTT